MFTVGLQAPFDETLVADEMSNQFQQPQQQQPPINQSAPPSAGSMHGGSVHGGSQHDMRGQGALTHVNVFRRCRTARTYFTVKR